jgi:DNA-binding NtrC family response regulator
MDTSKKNILLVDDNEAFREEMNLFLSEFSTIYEAKNYDEAIDIFKRKDISVTILDIIFKNHVKTGIDILKWMHNEDKNTPVIMCSVINDIRQVVECMKLGAYDYLHKDTITLDKELKIKIDECIKRETEKRYIEHSKTAEFNKYKIIGKSLKLQKVLERIKIVGNVNVVILGETGSGKTPIAFKIHQNMTSDKMERPFVLFNCGGATLDFMKAELYGQRPGAYTGGNYERKGILELSKGGDIFFDEIGYLPTDCQKELLVFLSSRTYRRLGEEKLRTSDCRIISATCCNVKKLIEQGNILKEFYNRISDVEIYLPPLRERKEDIQDLVNFYIEMYSNQNGRRAVLCSKDVFDLLIAEDWLDGNIRQLKKEVKCMVTSAILSSDDIITQKHLSPKYQPKNNNINLKSILSNQEASVFEEVKTYGFNSYMDSAKRKILSELLKKNPNIKTLSEQVQISERTLFRWIHELGIKQQIVN